MNLQAYGSHQPFRWTHEYVIKLITTGKQPILEDPVLINAFRSVDRADFVPENYKKMAYEDREIDIGYNEKLTRPTTTAMMLKLLKPRLGGKYLDIGSGSGYFATMLGKAIGEHGYIYSLERIQWLWETCCLNILHYPEVKNVKFLYRDGNHGFKEFAPYDGIHIAYDLTNIGDENLIDEIKEQLKVRTGVLVYPSGNVIKVVQRIDIEEYFEEIVPGYIFQSGKFGLA